jgi:hypothetical protein
MVPELATRVTDSGVDIMATLAAVERLCPELLA